MTIDDCQKRDLSKRYSKAFMGQFHYGTFYAYLKLKELEIQNIYHLAEIFNIDGFNKNHPEEIVHYNAITSQEVKSHRMIVFDRL